jgi:hypothetical protein
MNAAQLAALPPQARAQYFSGLPPAQAAAQQQALANYVNQMNRDYMKKTVRTKTVCPPASGSGVNQNYATATQLSYNAPVANNGFLEGFIIRISMVVTFAAGSSAVYASTKSGEMALIQNIVLNYQGTQWNISPYVLKDLARLQGIYEPTWPNTVLASANHQSTIDTYLSQGSLPVSGSSQTVTLEFFCPLNLLHPQDIRGLLPIDGDSTTAQIVLQTATALLGNDPTQNVWYAVSGSGHVITIVSGTVQVIAAYRNGKTMSQKDAMPINFDGVGTVQFQKDVSLTGLANATTLRQKITKLEQHYFALLTVIDGQQATDYCTTANINYMDLGTDETGSNLFWAYGTGTNLDIREYFTDIRYLLNQDLSQGIIPLAMAPVYNEADPSNRNGSHIMNCDPARNGWSAIHYGIQLATVTSPLSGVTPRVECHLVWVNPRGLVATS